MENNYPDKKIDIKKIFFFITIIPYIIFLLLGIYNFINSSFENKSLDLYALIEPLSNFWFDILIDFNIFLLCLIVFCIIYPIYYLLDISDKNKYKEITNNIQSKVSKTFVLYIISFIPYLFLVYSCIFGIDFGIFMNTSTYYGFEALLIAIINGSVIPVYPIILIFQIVYTIKKHKTFTPNMKKILKYIIISIILLILIPSIIYLVKHNNDLNNTFKSDKLVIENYLQEEFGPQHYNNIEIVKNSNFSELYIIKTPLLKYGFSIKLNEDRTAVINNSFYEEFVKENSIEEELNKSLNKLYELPDYMTIDSRIIKFDIKNYTKGEQIEKLLDTCEYKISNIKINKNSFDKQEIIEIIKNFYIKHAEKLDKMSFPYSLQFYVIVLDRHYADINTVKNNDILKLTFSGYNYGEGYTIKYDEISINLSIQ